MSHQTRPKPTRMVICDLCDQEIEYDRESPDSRGNVMHGISPAPGTVTSTTTWAILCWGRTRTTSSRPDLDKGVNYDFHGRCIADLVASKVAERKGEATT